MKTSNNFDVIIIGGSYSGLAAAMSLGRALRSVLLIDSGKPCNSTAPHSHNFITHDGHTPKQIADTARKQVLNYSTVQLYEGRATSGHKTESGFAIKTAAGDTFTSKKLIMATGLKDTMPNIKGFAECWGKSVIHCPYCHGYEVKHEKTGIILNGDMAFEVSRLVNNWTKDLVLFTNGPSALTGEQSSQLQRHAIKIIETEIAELEHQDGYLNFLVLKDNSKVPLKAIYARPEMSQHSGIPQELGCELTEQGLLKIDSFQKTTVPGVFACGDNSNFGRAVAMAVSSGTFAGIVVNKELIEEAF